NRDEFLASLEPDLEAMAAHLLELDGSSELARARFMRAYSIAINRQQLRRAATIASDIGAHLVDLNRHADALEWQDRAREYMSGPFRDEYIERTIFVRLAKLEKLIGRTDEAIKLLEKVQQRCEDGFTPDAYINALMTIHDVEHSRGRDREAERLLV